MADVGDNNFIRYIYRGEEDEIIPQEATHIIVISRVILRRAFYEHRNIVEVICHDKVEKIEDLAFYGCPNLRRVIMPGVKEVERGVFNSCRALTDVECGMLEIIGYAFGRCYSLRSINLPSARIVKGHAFGDCNNLTDVKFGSKLERIEGGAFMNCTSLERITIPLKDGLFPCDDTFIWCRNLMHVDLADEGAVLLKTVAALHLEEWRNEMNEEIDSINCILPTTPAFCFGGEKTQVIRAWIRSVLNKIIDYKAEHRRILSEAAAEIQHQYALPHDILTNSVLPFLALPSHTFEGENNEEEEAANSYNEEGATGREVEGEQETHGEEHLHENDFSGNDAEEVGNEESDNRGVKRQRR